MIAELDKLSEKVEMARATIVKLREDNEDLRARCDELRQQLSRFEALGSTPDEIEPLVRQVDALTRERDQMVEEREEVTRRVRGLLTKVEALATLS